jgi:ABC-type transporter Mla maintaining outer membrane lipid asymmetry ATPase subunit MlaF
MEKSSPPAIEFRDVSLACDERVLLDNVSFARDKGEMRILVGPSNCGKSTIIKLAIGLLKPDSGQILINGREITSLNEEELMIVREKVGVVLHDYPDRVRTFAALSSRGVHRVTALCHRCGFRT